MSHSYKSSSQPINNELLSYSTPRSVEEADQLTLHLDSVSLPLRNATVTDDGLAFFWTNHGLTWSAGDSVAVKITEPPQPNAYGYRTIWTALMTAGDLTRSTAFGYSRTKH